jgi:hypothetical protein
MFLGAMFPGGLVGAALLLGRLAAAGVLMFALRGLAPQTAWAAPALSSSPPAWPRDC